MIKEKCSRCGYDKYVGSLHIHHIDRDHDNNEEKNLIVLCANCHFEVHSKTVGERIMKSKCHALKLEYISIVQLYNICVRECNRELDEMRKQLTEQVPMR